MAWVRRFGHYIVRNVKSHIPLRSRERCRSLFKRDTDVAGKMNGDQCSWRDERVSNRTLFSRSPAAVGHAALRFVSLSFSLSLCETTATWPLFTTYFLPILKYFINCRLISFFRGSSRGGGGDKFLSISFKLCYRLCGLSIWLQIQRSGFDSRGYQIFWEVAGLERSPLSPVSITEELLGRKSSSGLENRDYCRGDPSRWPRDTPQSSKVGTYFSDKRRSLGRYSSLAD
jgi:hypothetical protein